MKTRRKLTMEDFRPTPMGPLKPVVDVERRQPDHATLRQLMDDQARIASAVHAERLRLGR